MNYLRFSEESTKEEIIRAIRSGTLIPIIGSGFTKGEQAKKSKVPSGVEFKKIMMDEILSNEKELKEEDFNDKSFSEVSEIFWEIVSEERRKDVLSDNFTNVKLSEIKKNFLNIDWPYVYTINIDDGIEKNSNFEKVLPYKKLNNKQINNMKTVFKMHGDVYEEIFYGEDERERIIFNKNQYIKSLEENKDILQYFISDYRENNIIYIGCSLDDEMDLHYAVNKAGIENYANNSRYFVVNQKLNKLDEIKLKNFGINKIIIVSDFNNFYRELGDIIKDSVIFGEEQLNDFKNPKLKYLTSDYNENLNYIIEAKSIYSDNEFIIPNYFIDRDKRNEALEAIENNDLTCIVGRRISGKTFLIIDIIKNKKNRDIFYFPSTVSVVDYIIDKLILLKNSLIIFDSNSIDYSNLLYIKKNLYKFKKNKNKIVVVANSNDNIIYTFLGMKHDYTIGEVEINNKFTEKEYKKINDKLSKLGIPEFHDKRGRYKLTILDNIVRIAKSNKALSNIIPETTLATDLSVEELKILILLATCDKIYRPTLNIIGVSEEELLKIKQKFRPIVDSEFSKNIEKIQHTNEKMICNSKTWLLYMLGKYSSLLNSARKIGSVIGNIVDSLSDYKGYSYIIKNIILFDNLNQIFTREEGGSIKVIFEVYENLQKSLYADKNYWLQRGKSILTLKRNDKKELEIGLKFTLKAYEDSSKDTGNKKIKENSSLTIAMIYGRLFALTGNCNLEYLNESIKWYYTAIIEYSSNKYIVNFIRKSARYKSDLNNLIKYFTEHGQQIDHINKNKAEELLKMWISIGNLESDVAITK